MLPHFGRIRYRSFPPKGGSNVVLGKFYPAILVGGVPTGSYSSVSDQTVVYNYKANALFVQAQQTMDSIHKKTGEFYREGDAFRSLKYDWMIPYDGIHGQGTYFRSDKMRKYVGGFQPPSTTFTLGGGIDEFDFANNFNNLFSDVSTNLPSMSGWGDKGYKRTMPKLEKASAFEFIGELRDVPRMLKTTARGFHDLWKLMGGKTSASKIMQPKKIADNFLNHQFGWSPFLKDLKDFDYVVQNYHDIIAKLVKRNDKWTRRRVTLKSEVSSRPIHSGIGNKCLPVFLDPGWYAPGQQPTWATVETKSSHITAVGVFKYYRPEFDEKVQDRLSQWNSAMQFLTVSGARINPSNLYNAVPWTWAIDWFANVGDYVEHETAVHQDALVSKYSYVMQHQRIERTFSNELPLFSGGRTLQFSRVIDSKQRERGNSPNGFSLTWDALTPRQLAIAAALGISRW